MNNHMEDKEYKNNNLRVESSLHYKIHFIKIRQ